MHRLISLASVLAILGCGSGNDDGPKGGAGGGGSDCGDVKTSAENCGACGHSCLGGTCRAGLCQPVTLADAVKATWLAVDDNYVYASEGEWDTVVRVPKSGGSAETIGSAAVPMGITATSQGVFWVYRGSYSRYADQGAIMRVPPGSTKSEVFLQPANMPCGVTADDTYLYWSDQGTLATGQTDGRIRRMPLAGGPDETVAAKVGAPCFLAVDAQWVYTFDFGDILLGDTPRLVKVSKSGGTPVTLVAAIEDPKGLALDQKAVYWTNQSSDTDSISHVDSVESVTLDGSKSLKVAASERWPLSLIVDAKFAYWITQNTELRRAPLDGSTAAVTIYSEKPESFAIFESLAQDATALYVGVGDSDSFTTGKLVKIAK